jgi:excisionase family DNA binding protein
VWSVEFTLGTGQAARRLGVSLATLQRLASAGRVPAWRTPGGQWRFRPADIDALIAEGFSAAGAEQS